MTQEEKAKRYDEAVKKAKNTIEVNQTIPNIVECVESLFPELKESEDEKIRKALVHLINEQDGFLTEINGISVKDILSWLEKQGEQNPAAWSEKDEVALGDALWCCKQAASIAKDENDMGNVWFAENWLKSLKEKVMSR